MHNYYLNTTKYQNNLMFRSVRIAIYLICFTCFSCITPPKQINITENQQIEVLNVVKKGKDSAELWYYAEAEQEFLKALKLTKADSGIYNNLAFVQMKQGKLVEARENLTHALELNPENIDAKINHVFLLFLEAQPEQTKKSEFSIEQLATIPIVKQNQIIDAYKDILDSSTKNPNKKLNAQSLSNIYQNLALIYKIQNQNSIALDYSRRAFDTSPDSYYAEQYAKLLIATDKTKEAEDFILSISNKKNVISDSLNTVLAIALYQNGKKLKALMTARKVLQQNNYTLEEYHTNKALILLTDTTKDLTKRARWFSNKDGLTEKDIEFCHSFENSLPLFWNNSFKQVINSLIQEVCND